VADAQWNCPKDEPQYTLKEEAVLSYAESERFLGGRPIQLVLFAYDKRVHSDQTRAHSPGAINHFLDRPAAMFQRQLRWLWRKGFRFLYLLDALIIFGLLFALNYLRFGLSWPTYSFAHYLTGFSIATAVSLIVNYFTGLYERDPSLGMRPWPPRVALAMGISVLVDAVFAVVFNRYLMPRLNLVALFVIGTFALTFTRAVSRRLANRRRDASRVALVGNQEERNRARPFITQHLSNAKVVFECDGRSLDPFEIKRFEVTYVFFVDLPAFEQNFPEPLTTLAREGVTAIQRVSAAETLLGLKAVYQIGGIPFIRLNTQGLLPHQQRLKRIVDLSIVVLGSPIWITLIAIVTAYSKIVSSSSVFYRQTRVGFEGLHFEILKFRTMYPDAEADSGPRLSEQGDDRVEPSLRWLRSSRLDELPQLWNVLRGQMSLVGPRPERPEFTTELEQQIPGYSRRHSIKPGVTGFAQVHGRYDTDAAHKLGYDLQYLVNWSLVLDLQLLVQTLHRFRTPI